jgi:hypothetical protein
MDVPSLPGHLFCGRQATATSVTVTVTFSNAPAGFCHEYHWRPPLAVIPGDNRVFFQWPLNYG